VNPLKDLDHFKAEVPVLGLLGAPVPIEHSSKFSITDEVQLVCKYLRAYETKRIDKLHRDGRWFISGNEVTCYYAILWFTFMHVHAVLLLSSVQILNFQKKSVKGFSINT